MDDSLPREHRAGIFHETMAQSLLQKARRTREETAFEAVGLSGGVFQNRFLTERVVELLTGEGFHVRLHREVAAGAGPTPTGM